MIGHALWGQIAGVLSLAGFIPYVIAILRGRTRPSLATWIIWTVVSVMLFASYRASGAEATLWAPLSFVIGPVCVVLISLGRGTSVWTRTDRLCLAASGATIIFWAVTGSPLVALFLNILVDCVGAIPTIRNTWIDGDAEDATAWSLFCAGAACNLAAAERWDVATLSYPLYLFAVSIIICALLLRWRFHRRATVTT